MNSNFFCKLTMSDGEVVKLRKTRNGVLTREKTIPYIDRCVAVEIGDTCTSIGKTTFQEFKNLKEIKLGNNVNTIGSLAFFASGISKIEFNENLLIFIDVTDIPLEAEPVTVNRLLILSYDNEQVCVGEDITNLAFVQVLENL